MTSTGSLEVSRGGIGTWRVSSVVAQVPVTGNSRRGSRRQQYRTKRRDDTGQGPAKAAMKVAGGAASFRCVP